MTDYEKASLLIQLAQLHLIEEATGSLPTASQARISRVMSSLHAGLRTYTPGPYFDTLGSQFDSPPES